MQERPQGSCLRMIATFLLLATTAFASKIPIEDLPGAPCLSTRHFHGYLNVSNNNHLHFWFIESQNDPDNDPILLWFSGGPGCSSLFAMLTETGPYLVKTDGQGLVENPYSWNRIANLLFFESPAGVGFSNEKPKGLNDNIAAEDNYAAILEFFKEFSQYQTNDFYITGESYAGVFIPMLAEILVNERGTHKINFKGMAIGNGCIDFIANLNTNLEFAYHHGLVDQRLWERAQRECCKTGTCHFVEHDGFCSQFYAKIAYYGSTSLAMNFYNMHAACDPRTWSRCKRSAEKDSLTCKGDSAAKKYLNLQSVRDALSIPSDFPPWELCNNRHSKEEVYNKTFKPMHRQVRNVLAAGAKVMLFYGDLDVVCNLVHGERFAGELDFERTEHKYAFTMDEAHAGFLTRYGNLEIAIVQGAGHMVPTDKPKVALYLMENFIHRQNYETLNRTTVSTGKFDVERMKEKPLTLLKPLPPLKTMNSTFCKGSLLQDLRAENVPMFSCSIMPSFVLVLVLSILALQF